MQPKTAKRRSAFRRANRTMPRRRIDIAIEAIDYKNPDLLKKFVTESGKILPRRVSQNRFGNLWPDSDITSFLRAQLGRTVSTRDDRGPLARFGIRPAGRAAIFSATPISLPRSIR